MGSSKYVTIAQAARLLGVSTRSIYRYTRRGVLQARCEGRHIFIAEEDVAQMKKGRRDVVSTPLHRDIITKQQAEIQTLKSQMATVMRILNIRHDPLSMTLVEYDLFYRTAEQMSIEGWSPHVEETWAEYFVRIRVEDLEKIELAVSDPHPWRPLLRLATTMHASPYNSDLADMFASGRTNMQQLAGVWCVLKEESPRTLDILLERDTKPLKKLLRRMQKDKE